MNDSELKLVLETTAGQSASERLAMVRAAPQNTKYRDVFLSDFKTKFISTVNTKGSDYFDGGMIHEEMEWLAGIAQEVFGDDDIAACVCCARLFIRAKPQRGWCSMECLKEFKQFCREERKREKRLA